MRRLAHPCRDGLSPSIDRLRPSTRRRVLAGLLLGTFLASMEVSIVSTAMPRAVVSLGGQELYSWVFTAYVLASTASGPLWGRTSDIYGRKRLYVAGASTFIAGATLSGAASDMLQLIFFRAIQGVGAGALLVLTFTIVGDMFSLKERAKVQGYTSSTWVTASVLGPLIGGFIADNIGWRLVFYINLPFGLLAMVVIWRYLRDIKYGDGGSVDFLGAALFTLATSSLLVYLNEYDRIGPFSLLILALAITSYALFIYFERRAENPFIPLQLFNEPLIRSSIIGNMLSGFAFLGSVVYVPMLLQWVVGLSATETGLVIIPYSLGWFITANASARLIVDRPVRPLVMLGGSSITAGMAILSSMSGGVTGIFLAGGFIGAGMGFVATTLLIATQTTVRRQLLGIATSMLTFMRQLGGAMGVAVMWIPISLVMTDLQLDSLLQAQPTLLQKREALIGAVSKSFLIGAVAAGISIPLYFTLPRGRVKE